MKIVAEIIRHRHSKMTEKTMRTPKRRISHYVTHVAYQIEGNGAKSTLWRTHSVLTHTQRTCGGVKRSNNFFCKSSHAAYQIKENGAQSTMQAHILSLYTPSTRGFGLEATREVGVERSKRN